jgi:predicted metal-binding membrane protein
VSVAERARAQAPAVWIAAGLLAACLVTWILVADWMQGMDAGPGTDLGGLGWYVGIWVTMMAAMMLPSVAPMVLLFARVYSGRAEEAGPFVPTWIFVAGYFAVWTLVGLAAYGLYRGIHAVDLGFLDWDAQGPFVAGAAVAAAGIYELTPLKRVCLQHCRGPLHFLMHGWREGRVGALRMGAEHGLYCVGCCVGLMLVLFAVGVMSVLWMAVIAALIFAEKVLPFGEGLTRVLAVVFVVAGIWIAAAPSTVPGLTQPGGDMRMQMDQNPSATMEPGAPMEPAPMEPMTP